MKKILSLGLAGTLLLAANGSALAAGKLEANIGVVSNYIWRGVTQTGDESAVQGGLDFVDDSGFYLGGWTSAAGGLGFELDLYGGYVFTAGQQGIELDVGLISYQYPNVSNASFEEIFIGADFHNGFTAKFSADLDNKNYYLEGAYDMPLTQGYDLSLHLGMYSRDILPDYNDFAVTLSKDDFSLGLTFTDDDIQAGNPTDNYRVVVGWTKTF